MNLDQIEAQLVQDFTANPNLVVYIRADENGRNKDLYAVIDRCQRNGITRYSLRTEPTAKTLMDRLQKKCLIASTGIHLLLVLILSLGPAFLSPQGKSEDPPIIDFVPSILVDAIVAGGGNPNAGPAGAATPSPDATTPAPRHNRNRPQPEPKRSPNPIKTRPRNRHKSEARSGSAAEALEANRSQEAGRSKPQADNRQPADQKAPTKPRPPSDAAQKQRATRAQCAGATSNAARAPPAPSAIG